MNKPTKEQFRGDQPQGDLFTWAGTGPFEGVNARRLYFQQVEVASLESPITWEGSFDGVHYAVMRDKEDQPARHTKPGLYRLPVPATHIRPVSDGAIVARMFIPKGV